MAENPTPHETPPPAAIPTLSETAAPGSASAPEAPSGPSGDGAEVPADHVNAHGQGGGNAAATGARGSKARRRAARVRVRLVRSGRKVNVKAAAQGLASVDPPTRQMSVFFWFSCAGCVVLLGLIVEQWVGRELAEWRAHRAALALAAPAAGGAHSTEAHTSEASAHGGGHGEGGEGATGAKKAPSDSFSLGLFTVELRSGPVGAPGGDNADHGSRSMGEVEVVVQCASVEAKEFAEKNIPQVRNQVLDALSGFNRDEFLDRAGKRKLKLMMLDNLKRALPQAQIRDLYFPRLMVR